MDVFEGIVIGVLIVVGIGVGGCLLMLLMASGYQIVLGVLKHPGLIIGFLLLVGGVWGASVGGGLAAGIAIGIGLLLFIFGILTFKDDEG